MSIDPDELKASRTKREQQIQYIQNYMDEQNALDKENVTGKMGHHEVKHRSSTSNIIENIASNTWNLLKGKSAM